MENKKILCLCGCGKELLEWAIRIRYGKEYPSHKRKFVNGHSARGKFNPMFGKPGARLGMQNTKEHNLAISKANKGRKSHFSIWNKFNPPKSERNGNWTGGKTDWWRKTILIRDDFTCQVCRLKDKEIMQVDHIKPKSKYPELRFNLSNGRAICPNCHERKSTKEKFHHE